MKSFIKIVLLAVPLLFIISYISIADNLLHFTYQFIEASMIAGIIYGTIWMYWNRKIRSAYGKKVALCIFSLVLLTHYLRVAWMLDLEGQTFKTGYFLKSYLFEPTLILAGNSLLLACLICFFIWLFKLPRKRLIKVAGVLVVFVMILSISFYLYIHRDLSGKNIYFDYSLNSLAEVKQVALAKQKTVYVDFWHSGCAPCLKEFKNHHAFREMVDETRVHFLFIGTDRSTPGEKQKQRLLIEKYDLRGTHSFVTREEFSEILDVAGYNVSIHGYKAFPHHMIISPDGRILEIKAESPSPALASKLNAINQANSNGLSK